VAKLPGFKRLNVQDFDKDSQPIVAQLAESLNYGIEVLYDTLNKKVTLADNIACSIRDVLVTVDGTGKVKTSTTCSLDNSNKVIGTQVIYAQTNRASTYPSGQPFVSFTQNGATLQIQHVAGLPQDIPFTIRLVAYT